MPRLKKPTQRHKLYLEGLSLGMTKKAAAISAGYSVNTAHNACRAIESQPTIKRIAFENYHYNSLVREVVFRLSQGMEAYKVVKVPCKGPKEKRCRKIRGNYEYQIVPDHRVRVRYLAITLKAINF